MELGPLSAIASQPGVTDIAVTCDGTVWADCGQGMQEVCLLRRCFPSAQSIREFAVRLCSQLGRRLDDACPIADASTVDGLRVHAVIAPLVPQGAAISIRLPDAVSPNLESLARNGMFPAEWLPLLAGLVSRKASVLVTGGTGAGKTTLINLLMRFYEISGGTISIDGIDTKSVPRWNVHDQFSMVLQDTWVFRGTVRENIAYSKKDVTDEQIVAACKAVGLHHYIMSLPNGYDTVLDDKASLSQGQRQLLTIARAMVEDAPILILDEATSSVDTRTEELIQKAMDALTVGRTSFVIAHRLSTIRDADMILVMNGGDIVERGTHEELLAKGGFYADIYNSQFTLAE